MQKTDCPEEKFKWELESVCIENTTATLLLNDDKIATAPMLHFQNAMKKILKLT
jgi:hypothetical protein